MKTAIFIDGAFYKQRAFKCIGNRSAEERAEEMIKYCYRHLEYGTEGKTELFRIYYYDCLPIAAKVFHPLRQEEIDLSRRTQYDWNMRFIEELKHKRKVALRMGILNEKQAHYTIRQNVLENILSKQKSLEELTERDFRLEVSQKGVDMQIGLDIASLAYKRLCEQIVLISGDSDFVPAAKLARSEGIDFILDSLGAYIKPELYENIDGLRYCDDRYKTNWEDRKRAELDGKTKETELTEEEKAIQEEINKEYEKLHPVYQQLLDNLTI